MKLRFNGNRISAVERGVAFDAEEWSRISATIDALTKTAPDKIGRDIAFSGQRVTGWWRGAKSGVQILPPPAGASIVPTEMGEHPFILEFPIYSDDTFTVKNARRRRERRKLVLLLNVLLRTRVNCEPQQTEHAWCRVGSGINDNGWLQLSYFADLGEVVNDALSNPAGEPMEAIASNEYYARLGNDGKPLRVPSDLDELICRYRNLGPDHREKFDRALFWIDVASRQWTTSMSSSFASLVSAIESLTERGVKHRVYCDECGEERDHDVPGPTALFRNFFETYAPGLSLKKRRGDMYALRSGILHGDQLISFDEGRAFGWDPPWRDQNELHVELWSITRNAVRNYLMNPGADKLLPTTSKRSSNAGQSVDGRRKLSRREMSLLAGMVLAAATLGAGLAVLVGRGRA